jgi:hypothetical protein
MCYRRWKRFLRIFRGEHDIWSLFCCRGPIACLHQHPKGGARLRAERGRNRAFVNKITHIEQGPAWRRVGNRGQKEKAKTATILIVSDGASAHAGRAAERRCRCSASSRWRGRIHSSKTRSPISRDLMIFIDPVIGRLVLWRPRMVAPSPSRRDGRRQVVPPHVVAYRGGVVASALACVEQKGPQA